MPPIVMAFTGLCRGMVPGNGENAGTVAHHDLLALANHVKPRLLERADGVEMVDAREFRHG